MPRLRKSEPFLAFSAMSPSLKASFIGLIAFSVLFFVIERLIARAPANQKRKGWWTDVLYWFFTPLVAKSLTRAFILLPLGLLIWFGLATRETLEARTFSGFGPLSHQPIALQILEIYLLGDFISYWTHRLFHGGKWWPFHAVHHSSEDLDWLSSVRVHPVNDLVNKMLQASPLLLLGFNPLATLSVAPFTTFYAIFLHARVNWDLGPLRYIIASPVFHRWHHSREPEAIDKNFAGLFPFIDAIFGTLYMPKDRKPENFGVLGEFPQHFAGQMWVPFARLRRKQPTTSSSTEPA